MQVSKSGAVTEHLVLTHAVAAPAEYLGIFTNDYVRDQDSGGLFSFNLRAAQNKNERLNFAAR
jgi:hypothetical protein